MISRLKSRYQKEIQPKLKDELGISNIHKVPKLSKVVINVGAGEAKDNQSVLDRIIEDLTALTGQKPVITKAKKSISGFKVGKGQPVGASVTLRDDRMYNFLDKLITVALPKVRDFRGLSTTSFDNQGNYTLGLRELSIFPEVTFKQTGLGSKLQGLEVCIVSTADDRVQGRKLLELIGVPFRKDSN